MKRQRTRDLQASDLSRVAGGRVAGRAGGTTDGDRPDAGRGAAAILLVGFDAALPAQLRSHLPGYAEVLCAPSAQEGFEMLAARRVAVLCLGERLSAGSARSFLDRTRDHGAASARQDVVLAAGPDLALFQDLVDAERIFYLTPRPPPPTDLAAIVESALQRHRGLAGSAAAAEAGEDEWILGARSILELTHRLATETRLDRAAESTAREARQLLGADHADCRIHDPADQTLWRPGSSGRGRTEDADRDSTAAGLVGFVARTGRAVQLPRIGVDPRYDPDADNDHGSPDEAFVAVPIASAETVLAVLVARRRPSLRPFAEPELRCLELLARQVAPVFARLLLERQLHHQSAGIYRPEAVEHHVAGPGDRGQPLRISPRWTRWVLALLILVFLTAVPFASLGSIHEYAVGPAVVRLGNRLDVTAEVSGIVASVDVQAGQWVARGDLLARFHSEQEAAELARVREEFELGLVQVLLDPSDPAIGRALSTLRAQRQLAESRLEARSVRAPQAGWASDVRVRPGQHLSPGQVVATLAGKGQELGIIALLPGHYRPLLRRGMPLRLELQGYRYAYQRLTVESIGGEVIGPAEARRFLGEGIGDAVALQGPVVWVRARLPSDTFESDGRTYRYHDGIQGTAEVQVRSERILTTLVPALQRLFGESHD